MVRSNCCVGYSHHVARKRSSFVRGPAARGVREEATAQGGEAAPNHRSALEILGVGQVGRVPLSGQVGRVPLSGLSGPNFITLVRT